MPLTTSKETETITLYRCEDHGFALEAGEDSDAEAGGTVFWCLGTNTKVGFKGPYQVPCNKPVEKIALVDALMEAQADIQTPLGFIRLREHNGEPLTDDDFRVCIDRLTKSCARLHLLLGQLGNPMWNPATHPEIPGGEDG